MADIEPLSSPATPLFLIPHYLRYHASRQPERPALSFCDRELNYGELLSRANCVARFLVARGVRRGDRVGIHMDKALELGVALHGILMAGAAYVPLDPMAPATRLATMIKDCDIVVVFSAQNKRAVLVDAAAQLNRPVTVVGLDCDGVDGLQGVPWNEVDKFQDGKSFGVKCLADDLAYIIYTSGSTGVPKGIMHSHHSSLSYACWAAAEYGLTPHDRLGNHAPLHFDISIYDFIAGVVAGCCTVIIPEEVTGFPASYSGLLESSRITVLFTVPFALIQLAQRGVLDQRDVSALRWIIFGGEPMPRKHLRRLQELIPGARFDNMYGPAEVNGVTHYTVPSSDTSEAAIPIGPISQVAECLVVDSDLAPVAAGETGELLVRSPTMMLGYWRRPKLSSRAIVSLGADGEPKRRYYRTGDLVRGDADGTLWFAGRVDRQVKVRGYRVELDEIEATLVAHPAVEEAAAFTMTVAEGATEIRAAVRPATNERPGQGDLMRYLKQRLPAYAVPVSIGVQDAFPRTATGKIDRLALSVENEQ